MNTSDGVFMLRWLVAQIIFFSAVAIVETLATVLDMNEFGRRICYQGPKWL